MAWLKNNALVAGVGGLLGLGVLAYLAFGVFGIHTLFTDEEVSEANPFDNAASVEGAESDGDAGSEDGTGSNPEAGSDAETETTGSTREPAASEADSEAEMEAAMADLPEVNVEETEPEMDEVAVLASGMFEGRDHPAEGSARILSDGTQTFLRFEDDFATDNGPDLNVYLSRAPIDADDDAFGEDPLDLGDLKGNIGSQNYEIDPDLDVSEYSTVVVWCVRFGVAFGAAPLDA